MAVTINITNVANAWRKLKKWFERQIPHPRETMIFIIILMFLVGKLIMLYIDETMTIPTEDDQSYLTVDEFLYEQRQQQGR